MFVTFNSWEPRIKKCWYSTHYTEINQHAQNLSRGRGAIVQIKNQEKVNNYMSENQFALCSFPYDAERLGTR